MKITYNGQTGNILQAIYDRDIFAIPDLEGTAQFTFYIIDELDPDNKSLCRDIIRTQGKLDSAGDGKYKIIDGVLSIKENWEAVSYDL